MRPNKLISTDKRLTDAGQLWRFFGRHLLQFCVSLMLAGCVCHKKQRAVKSTGKYSRILKNNFTDQSLSFFTFGKATRSISDTISTFFFSSENVSDSVQQSQEGGGHVCSSPDAHLFQNTKSEHSMNIYVIPTYIHRQMLYLPAALNSKKMLGNMSAVVLLPTFSYTPSLSSL